MLTRFLCAKRSENRVRDKKGQKRVKMVGPARFELATSTPPEWRYPLNYGDFSNVHFSALLRTSVHIIFDERTEAHFLLSSFGFFLTISLTNSPALAIWAGAFSVREIEI